MGPTVSPRCQKAAGAGVWLRQPNRPPFLQPVTHLSGAPGHLAVLPLGSEHVADLRPLAVFFSELHPVAHSLSLQRETMSSGVVILEVARPLMLGADTKNSSRAHY